MTLASWGRCEKSGISVTILIDTTWAIQGQLRITEDIETEVTNLVFHRPSDLDSLYWKWPLVGQGRQQKT